MRRVFDYLFSLIKRGHWWAELWSALVAISWGCSNLAMNPQIKSLAAYNTITQIIQPWHLEVLATCVGVAQLATLLCDFRWLRASSAFMAGWFYAFIALGAWESFGFFPNVVLFVGYVGINMFAIGRLCGNLR